MIYSKYNLIKIKKNYFIKIKKNILFLNKYKIHNLGLIFYFSSIIFTISSILEN